MKYYAKIENEQTKAVSVGAGTNAVFYEAIGMTMMDVEQSDIDGQWYEFGYAPMKSEEQKQKEAVVALQKHYTDLIQRYLDETAHAYGYTGVNEGVAGACNSVCTYVDTGVAKFDAEGVAFRKWRSAVWGKGYELLAEVQAGARPVPTEEELVALLPELVIEYDVVDGTQA